MNTVSIKRNLDKVPLRTENIRFQAASIFIIVGISNLFTLYEVLAQHYHFIT